MLSRDERIFTKKAQDAKFKYLVFIECPRVPVERISNIDMSIIGNYGNKREWRNPIGAVRLLRDASARVTDLWVNTNSCICHM